MLREGILKSSRICVAFGERVAAALTALGADVTIWPAPPGCGEEHDETVEGAVASVGAVDVLVVDAAARHADAGAGIGSVRAAIDDTFVVVRAVCAAWTGADGAHDGGKVILIAPEPGGGDHADAAGAALENMARTLSTEWSRFGVRITCIRPRAGARTQDIDGICSFLASAGGDYFTGGALRPGPVAA